MMEINDPSSHPNKPTSSEIEEIHKPKDFKIERKGLKTVGLLVILGIASIAGYILIRPYFQKSELKGFYLRNFGISEINNSSATIVASFQFEYYNEYGMSFQLGMGTQNLELQMQNRSFDPWQKIGIISNNQTVPVNISSSTIFFGVMNISNSLLDADKRMFMGEILKRSNFSLRIIGSITVVDKPSDAMPDKLDMDVIKKATDLFGYGLPSNGPSTFIFSDIITPGVDPANPSLFQLGILCRFRNPLNVPISFVDCEACFYNRTLDGLLGCLKLNPVETGIINAGGCRNLTRFFFVPPAQIAWIISDLLSEYTDVLKVKNLNATVDIGKVRIYFARALETEESDIKFELIIKNYRVDGTRLFLDLELVNPCNVTFNMTYIDLDMFLAHTTQRIVWIEQELNLTILPYSRTQINNIEVNADVAAFLQHINDLMDLIGYLKGSSYNSGELTINYDSRDVDIIS